MTETLPDDAKDMTPEQIVQQAEQSVKRGNVLHPCFTDPLVTALRKAWEEIKFLQKPFDQVEKVRADLIEADEGWSRKNDYLSSELELLKESIEEFKGSLPYYSGRDENKVNEALGEVMRHSTGPHGKSIGVVDANRANHALLHAYAESNELNDEVERLKKQAAQPCSSMEE